MLDYNCFMSIVRYELSKLLKLDLIKDNKLPDVKKFYLDYDCNRS